MRTDQSNGLATLVPNRLAASQHPFVTPIFGLDTILGRIKGNLVIQMLLQLTLYTGKIVGVHTGLPLFGLIPDLLLLVPQNLLPARGIEDLSGLGVPVPQTVVVAAQRQLPPFL